MRRCEECGGLSCDPGCPAYEEVLPEADEDERGGEYEDDEPREYDYQAALDARHDARERMLEAWRLKR